MWCVGCYRQYFENCTTENTFIGYSTETTAIAVRQATADVGQATPEWHKEVCSFENLSFSYSLYVVNLGIFLIY